MRRQDAGDHGKAACASHPRNGGGSASKFRIGSPVLRLRLSEVAPRFDVIWNTPPPLEGYTVRRSASRAPVQLAITGIPRELRPDYG
jgi:hypothetical protein